jgi:hypothetical protein
MAEKGRVVLRNKDGKKIYDSKIVDEMIQKVTDHVEVTKPKKISTNDALWAIADDLRDRKDNGEFDTYREAYRWGEENINKKGVKVTAHNLERAYHKARSEGKIE